MNSWFSQDDLLNLYYCWSRPVHDLFAGGLFLGADYSRPVGELVYFTLYHSFGFHPAAFNVARLTLCCLNLGILYFWAARLSRRREVAAIAVLLAGFHPAAVSLYFDTGMIFDVLAFLFYFAAFSVYLGGRQALGSYLRVGRTIAVSLLYIAALDSKEIAVTFPVALLLYELTAGLQTPAASLWKRWRTLVLSCLITLAFIFRKTFGPEAFDKLPAYHPVPSFAAYFSTFANYIADFTFLTPHSLLPFVPWMLAGSIGLALLTRNRLLLWASLFNLFAILPIAFIPPRDGFAFEVPLAGWAIYLAVLISWLREKTVPASLGLRIPSQIAVFALLALLVLKPEADFMRNTLGPVVHDDQNLVRDSWTSLRTVLPANLASKRVLALHDPFRNPWGLMFLIQLGYHDKGITVDTARLLEQQHLAISPASYDYVLDYAGGKFFLIQRVAGMSLNSPSSRPGRGDS